MTPNDLDAIQQAYGEELGGITRIDVSTEEPVISADGVSIVGRVDYISQGQQRHEEFTVTVQEDDESYCVSDAVQAESEETDGPGADVDPAAVASDFLTTVVAVRKAETAAEYQCDSYTGPTPDDLIQAIADWESQNSESTGQVLSSAPAEAAEGSITMVTVEAELRGFSAETFTFEVGVQEDCVASLEGGEGLIDADQD